MGIESGNEDTSKDAHYAAHDVRRFAGRYLLVLALIAGLIVVDQVAVQPFVSRLGSFAPTINAAGRQRMLSQKLAKAALALQVSSDEAQREARIRELRETLDQWSTAHLALREGSSELLIRKILTDEIESEWDFLEPHFQGMHAAALAIVRPQNVLQHGHWRTETATIVRHEPAFLASMDCIVSLMENEAAVAVFRLRACAGAIAASIVGLVVVLGWFVVKPATRTIRRHVDELENQVADRTRELATALDDLRQEVVDREVAELKNQRLAAQLAHAARVSTMGHLAAGLAHELNQPLATIANYTEACDVELSRHQVGPPSERLRKNLEHAKNAALRAGQIVRRMRNFVRPGPQADKCTGIHRLIREVVEFCRTEIDQAGATIALDLANEHAAVSVDPIQIQQVLINLLQNALHAVWQCSNGNRQVVVRTSITTEFVQADVIDSGPGFKASDSEIIFAPFYTTKREGLGIGLSISRAIVEEHGGTIWASAASGRGAIVSFTLPRVFNVECNVGTSRTPAACVCS